MSIEFPPEMPDGKESWDEYKKRIKNKYGDKYDLNLIQIEGWGQAMEENSNAYMELSLEEKIEYLEKCPPTRNTRERLAYLRKELESKNKYE